MSNIFILVVCATVGILGMEVLGARNPPSWLPPALDIVWSVFGAAFTVAIMGLLP